MIDHTKHRLTYLTMVLFLEGIFLAPKGTVVTTIDLLSIQQ
jgi:hypothetical protein